MTRRFSNSLIVGGLALVGFTFGMPAGSAQDVGSETKSGPALDRILFASCLREDRPAPIFESMRREKADLVLLLGDNIYADTDDMEVMKSKYAKLAAVDGFARLRMEAPFMATWDDHDYGLNDAGADYEKRAEAQELFVNFWGDSPDSPRRSREGIYESRLLGPEGKRVQVLMLDTRYFRGPLKTGERRVGGPYYPELDPSVPMLGEAQWTWLEQQLRKPADLRLMVSSIQFLATAAGQETWSNLPAERQRMIDLITETGAEGVIFLSGDRHWSEFSKQDEGAPYPLYDFTSSSLNQLHARGTPTENRWRFSDTTWHRENYGLIEIDWAASPPAVTVSIRDLEGKSQLEHRLNLDELRP